MNPVQIPFLVEALILVGGGLLGWWLSRKGRPYGKVKAGFHIFFFVWFSVGLGYIATGVFSTGPASAALVPMLVMLAAWMTQVSTGLVLLFGKTAPARLVAVHLWSAAALLLADAAAFVVTAVT